MRSMLRFTALAALTLAAMALAPPVAQAQAASPTAAFTKAQDWGSGYEAKYTITNGGTTAMTGWRVEFDLASGSSVGAYWDSLLTKSGNHHTFTNREYNGSIAAGASVTFGFIVGGSATPANCLLNGSSCTGGGTPGAPGTPGTPTVTATTDTSVSLSWSASTGTVTGYRVYEGTAVKSTGAATTATISGLAACSGHSYTVTAYNSAGESTRSAAVSVTTTGCTGGGAKGAAPYLYFGWGEPPNPTTVMNATGVKSFTMAFILSSGGCNPGWDGERPLLGGVDAQAITQIRNAGGDVVPSFGGWSGNKLGPNCSTPQALAGAYQKVIDAYGLKSIDIDIENTDEFESAVVQDRILNALKIIEQNNPGITTIVTFGTAISGPTEWGNRLIEQAKALAVPIDVYTIMPFDFGNSGTDMYASTVSASEALKNKLKSVNGWTDAVAYAHMGISGMNGLSDNNEMTTPQTWTRIRDWAKSHGLPRLAFWSVNRDRPCPGGGLQENCSGIDQQPWQFTQITAGL